MNANSMLGVQDGELVLRDEQSVNWRRKKKEIKLTWPAVSIISQSYSAFLKLTVFANVDSIVG
jgi:ABC-type polar amino acid transport system ATPase subunit